MINVLIIDDEAPAREIIIHYLQDYQDLHVVGEASNGFEAMKLIKELSPDLIFLDIQMPKLTGFEMLELIDDPPAIIFSTAYDEFAIKAFELNAIDYLLKPYSKQRFAKTVEKIRTKYTDGKESSVNLYELKKTVESSVHILTRIAVKDRQQIHIVQVQEIDYIESNGDYVNLHTEKGTFMKEKTMKYLELHLPTQNFIRIHRSYIVNVNKVSKIELYEKEKYRVSLKNGIILKASSRGYKVLKEVIRL